VLVHSGIGKCCKYWSARTSGAIQHGDPTNVCLVLWDRSQPALRSGVAADPRSASMMPLLLLTRMLPALISLVNGRQRHHPISQMLHVRGHQCASCAGNRTWFCAGSGLAKLCVHIDSQQRKQGGNCWDVSTMTEQQQASKMT
jgi:hypothetical protein